MLLFVHITNKTRPMWAWSTQGSRQRKEEKMRKIEKCLFMVAVVLALVGCPAPIIPVNNANSDGNDALTGSLLVKGDLFGRDGQKTLPYEQLVEIGDSFKWKAASIGIYLYDIDRRTNRWFAGPIVDGRFEESCEGILPGTYEVWINVTDKNGWQLFGSQSPFNVVIEAGKTTSHVVTLNFFSSYGFDITIPNLAGNYDEWGNNVIIVGADGNEYSVWWDHNDGQMIIHAWLPLDFGGGALNIVDQNGMEYWADLPLVPADLDWSTYNFGNIIVYDFVPPTWLGGLNIDIEFEWERETSVPVPVP